MSACSTDFQKVWGRQLDGMGRVGAWRVISYIPPELTVSTIGSEAFSHSASIRACGVDGAAIIGVKEETEVQEVRTSIRAMVSSHFEFAFFFFLLSWNTPNQSRVLIYALDICYFVIHLTCIPSTENSFLLSLKGGQGLFPAVIVAYSGSESHHGQRETRHFRTLLGKIPIALVYPWKTFEWWFNPGISAVKKDI